MSSFRVCGPRALRCLHVRCMHSRSFTCLKRILRGPAEITSFEVKTCKELTTVKLDSASSLCSRRWYVKAAKTDSTPKASGSTSDDGASSESNHADKWLTAPNVISGFRLFSAPVVVYCILNEQAWAAATLFGVSAVSDWIDGLIARRWSSQRSNLGTILDPLADKVLVCSAAVALTYVGSIPLVVTAAYFAKDLGLVLASVYIRIRALRQHGYSVSRFFDTSIVRIEVRPSLIGKLNTVLQLSVLCGALVNPLYCLYVPSSSLVPFVNGLAYCSLLTTTAAALSYTKGMGYKVQ